MFHLHPIEQSVMISGRDKSRGRGRNFKGRGREYVGDGCGAYGGR